MKLIVLKNNVPQSEIELEVSDLSMQYEFFVGRADDCHVLIDDPLISRHHLVIRNEGSQWVCEKLSQLGVVTVNGSAAAKSILTLGSEIRAGSYSIVIAEMAASTSPAVSYQPQSTPTYQSQILQDDIPTIEEQEDTIQLPSAAHVAEEEVELGSDDLAQSDDAQIDEDLSNDLEQSLIPDGFNQSPEMSSEFGSEANDESGGELSPFAENQVEESNDNESTRIDQFFINYQLTLFGEHAPYDRFQITQDEIFIGRDEKKCLIILNDPEVSSIHAVLRRSRIDMVLEDLNSSNGTILNGERINRAHIGPGDEFVIGGTSFTLEVQSDLLDSEKSRLMPVEKNQFIEKEEIEEELVEDGDDLSFDTAPEEKSILKRIWKDPAKRKKAVIYGAVAIMGAVLLMPEEEPKAPVVKTEQKKVVVDSTKPKLSPNQEKDRNTSYETGVDFFDRGDYARALDDFSRVISIDPEYKNVQSYFVQTKTALKKIKEDQEARDEEKRLAEVRKEVEALMDQARDAVKEHQVEKANSLFGQIIEKDPENDEVRVLRQDLEYWQREQERIAIEKAAKEAARKAMVDALSPGKTFYLKKEWYRATLKLEEFLRKKGMDEDLIKEASDMLTDSRNQLASDLGPILGKARSLKEGQDLKNAYETFLEVLRLEPTNTEALNEVEDIRSQLDARSKKIYREAIIAESLSLFGDAKEKFQEVQQVSPTDSDYYKKATEKLKNYLE